MFGLAIQKQRQYRQRKSVVLSQFATITMQRGVTGVGYLKERWTEEQVLNLPMDEHDYFERKSGAILASEQKRSTLAKAVSAFANSSGGHIILGQQDDGAIDGVPVRQGKTPIHEWLEQTIPNLVSYPLTAFRVHRVERASESRIPKDKELIVIDVGDSSLAPHQAASPNDERRYYFREAGKSKPAPHHYLEALRNRFVAATLEVECTDLDVRQIHSIEGRQVVEFKVVFVVTNTSRVACYKWDVDWSLLGDPKAIVTRATVSEIGRRGSIVFDATILPTQRARHLEFFGLRLDSSRPHEEQLKEHLFSLELKYRAIAEQFIGDYQTARADEITTFQDIDDQLDEMLQQGAK